LKFHQVLSVPPQNLSQECSYIRRNARKMCRAYHIGRDDRRDTVLYPVGHRREVEPAHVFKKLDGAGRRKEEGRSDPERDRDAHVVQLPRNRVGIVDTGNQRSRHITEYALGVEGELVVVARGDAEGRVCPGPRHGGASLFGPVVCEEAGEANSIYAAAVEGEEHSKSDGGFGAELHTRGEVATADSVERRGG